MKQKIQITGEHDKAYELSNTVSDSDSVVPTGAAVVDYVAGNAGSSAWGGITGTLSNQTDLNNALSGKQATLVSGTNIKTVNSTSLLGSGDLSVGGGTTIVSAVKTTDHTLGLGSDQENVFSVALAAGKKYIVESDMVITNSYASGMSSNFYFGAEASGGLTLTNGALRWNFSLEYASMGYMGNWYAKRITAGLVTTGTYDANYGTISISNDPVVLKLRGHVTVNNAGTWNLFLMQSFDTVKILAGSYVKFIETV